MDDPGWPWRLAEVLARSHRAADVLPELHLRALAASGGSASVVLRLNPRTGEFHPDSAVGVDYLETDSWLLGPDGRYAVDGAWADRAAIVVTGLAEVAVRLRADVAIIAPLTTRDRPFGILLVTASSAARADESRHAIAAIADVMSLAFERAQLQREADLRREVGELVAALSGSVSSSSHLAAGLDTFCRRAATLFAADRVSVWLHDRQARTLVLAASSDAGELASTPPVPIDDERVDVAVAMRRTAAGVFQSDVDGSPHVLAPLRGRRRALGTLELRGVRIGAGEGIETLNRVEEVARQISASIENVWLLEELLRSRRELESTFNSLTDLVIVSDGLFRVTQANRAFATRVGRQSQDLVGHPLVNFFGRDVMGWIERGANEHSIGPGDESREIADEKLNGTFLFTLSPLVGHADERTGTVIVARDVTAQARLEAERAELRNRLTQSEKLAALGQFVAGIAHELNNPLQGVLGHVELLLHEGGAASRFRRELKLVFREADRAAKIVHNLLVFAGSRRITRRRLNANNVVEKVLTLRAPACAAASITIVKDLAPKLPRVAGDALLLQQAILNIVLNAEQAMAAAPPPRRLEVRTRAVRRHRIEIEIADSGPGISPEALQRLFEPFFTTKEVGQGTGLGLAIAYGVVQEHGGQLQAANRPGGGATFTMALPVGFADAVE